MANLTESPIYEPGIFQLEKSTPPLGGAPVIDNGVPSAGHANAQGLQLANRTAYLKQEVDAIEVDVVDLDGRVDTAETDITNLQGQVTSNGSATVLRSDLANSSDNTKGASSVGFDGTTIYEQSLNERKLNNYVSLRAYTGLANRVKITQSGLTGFYNSLGIVTGYTDNGGTVIISTNGRVWVRDFSPSISPKVFGATSGGIVDATSQIQLAVQAIEGTNSALDIDDDYLVTNVNGVRITKSIRIAGNGRIIFDNYATSTNSKPVFFTDTAIPANSTLRLENFTIQGKWSTTSDFSEANSLISCFNFKKFIINNLQLSNSRSGGIVIGNCDFASVKNCIVERTYRDGIRISNAKQAIVSDNSFRDICDDAIAVTNLDTDPFIETSSTIENNNLVDSQGIAALGAKITNISGNNIYRAIHRAILVGQAENTFAEGHTASLAININGNNIVDGFSGTAFSADSGSGFNAIHISGKPLIAKDTVETGVSGVVIKPYPYFYTKSTDVSPAINMGNFHLSVTNNVISRTFDATSAYANYGFGQRLSRSGYVNPAISLTQMMVNGIYMTGGGNGLNISNNSVDGCINNIYLNLTPAVNGASLRNYTIKSNIIKNFRDFGIIVNANGFVEIEYNIFDGDPYLENSRRGSAGSWASSFASHSGVYIPSATTVLSSSLVGNTFKNVGLPFNQAGGENYASCIRKANKLICQPSVTGYSASNKGIGFVPKASNLDAMMVIEDCTPSSATFKRTLNVCLTSSPTLPSSGYYLAGCFVLATDDSASYGWKRITNGSNHVLGTDWIAV